MSVLAPRDDLSDFGYGPAGLGVLTEAVLALRSTRDLGTACQIAGDCAARALGASEFRLMRVDARSGTLRLMEDDGVETPYLAEANGPVERVLSLEASVFDDGSGASVGDREALLWSSPPAALAAIPLFSGSALFGCLLVGFAAAHPFGSGDRRLLQTLADALALALERATLQRLLDDERQRRIELERRVSLSEEASSNLMATVASEIRTPLTAIKAYTETLLTSLDNPHTPRERFLGIIHEECDRLQRLVSDVLDLSRLEAGQRPLRLSRFDLHGLVTEVVGELTPAARARRVRVAVEVPVAIEVECDRDLLKRLFANLIANAIRFSPPGQHAPVTVATRGDHWTLTVADQGPAIPAAELARVFERFARARTPGEPPVEGSGLGLAIARGIAELHGGRLWVEGPAEGGVRFHGDLPLRQMASVRARRIARTIVGRSDLRALFEETVEMVAAVMDAEIVSLMLVDPDRGDLVIVAARGLEGQSIAGRRTPVRSGVAGSVAAWARPVLVDNIETDRRFQRLNHPQYSTKSLLSVPLTVEGEVLGVINVNNKSSRASFDEHDLSVLVALVERVGSAVERAYAYPDSGRAVNEAVAAVRSVTHLHAEGLLGTRHHVRHARLLARELGLPDHEVDLAGYCATIHDVGMGPLQRRVWAVPGPLAEDDRRAVESHPEASLEILRPLEYLSAVRDIVLAHHERWDGAGYPRALAGTRIPIGARILAVVDAYESMTAGRPWRAARTHDQTLVELRGMSGAQFDPDVVEAFLRVIERERAQR